MRRGLKLNDSADLPDDLLDAGFKPIPDEEGTETPGRSRRGRRQALRFKPIPDEEGTETVLAEAARSLKK